MWLLNTKTIKLKSFDNERETPRYGVLSHTWGDDEVAFQEIRLPDVRKKAGYKKIQYCCKQALQDELEWVWVDT